MQALQLCVREFAGLFAWTNARAKQALIRVDIAHAMQDGLIQQCGFNCQLAAFEELGKIFRGDGSRLRTWPRVAARLLHDAEPPKAAWVDKANFASITQ